MSAPAVSQVADLIDPAIPNLINVVAAPKNTHVLINSANSPMAVHESHKHSIAAVTNSALEDTADVPYALRRSQHIKTMQPGPDPHAQQNNATHTAITTPVILPLVPRNSADADVMNRNVVSSRSSTNADGRVPVQVESEHSQPHAVGESTSMADKLGNDNEQRAVASVAMASTAPSLVASAMQCSRVRQKEIKSLVKRRKRGSVGAQVTLRPMTRKRRRNNDLMSHVQIGDEISVYWADDKQYYDGIVKEKLDDGTFRIVYFDNDVEILDLGNPKETWHFRGAAAERSKASSSSR